jgi:uncharacterized protein YoxC
MYKSGGIEMNRKVLIYLLTFIFVFVLVIPEALSAGNQPTVAELQKKITALTKQVKDLTSNLAKRNKEMTALKKEKTTLQNQVKSKNTTIDGLQQEVEAKEYQLQEQNLELENLEKLLTANFIYTDLAGKILSTKTGDAIKWYEFKTDQTTIYLTLEAYKEYSYLPDIANQISDNLSKYFGGKRLNQNVQVFISFTEPITKSGGFYSDENRIFLKGSTFYPFKTSTTRLNMADAYVHELAHAYQRAISPELFNSRSPLFGSYWLREGSASYVQSQLQNYLKTAIPQKHTLNFNKYSIEEYKGSILGAMKSNKLEVAEFTKLPERLMLHKGEYAYELYASFIYWIENEYGHEKMLAFLETLNTLSLREALVKNFGKTEEQFVAEWKKFYSL